jgi:hypothetical protein
MGAASEDTREPITARLRKVLPHARKGLNASR